MPSIRTLLDLATAHLPEHLCTELADIPGITATDTGYGWLLWVPTRLDDHIARFPGIPPQVLAIQRYAHALGCAYVLFDNSVEPDPELPVWDW